MAFRIGEIHTQIERESVHNIATNVSLLGALFSISLCSLLGEIYTQIERESVHNIATNVSLLGALFSISLCSLLAYPLIFKIHFRVIR